MYHPTVIPRSNERTGPPIIPSPPTNPKGPPASPCLASDTAAGSSTSQVMNLMNVEASASPWPIVVAFARGPARQTAEDTNRDPAINNNSDAEDAGSNV